MELSKLLLEGCPMTALPGAISEQFLVGKEYKLLQKLGMGSFGDVYLAESSKSTSKVAIKCESSSKLHKSQLVREHHVYQDLHHALQTAPPPFRHLGIPRIYGFFPSPTQSYLVMEELGPSIEDLFNQCNRCFSLKTVLMIGIQALNLLEFIHSQGYVHRDVKPENFLTGLKENGNPTILYSVDFGLAKRIFTPENARNQDIKPLKPHKLTKNGHIPFRSAKGPVGTMRYASIHSHLGFELSRRDDLESLGYMLIYLLKGKLPWSNVNGWTRRELPKILGIKNATPIKTLCEGLPGDFVQYFEHVKSLDFEDKPNYALLRRLFHQIALKFQLTLDYVYDWSASTPSQNEMVYLLDTADELEGGNKGFKNLTIEISNGSLKAVSAGLVDEFHSCVEFPEEFSTSPLFMRASHTGKLQQKRLSPEDE